MAPRSAVERSEHRDEIDDLLLEGKSPRFVSSWLENEYNEHISHTAINNYRKNKLNVPREAAIEYNKRKKEKEAAKIKQAESDAKSNAKKNKKVRKTVSDLEKLDFIIEDSYNTTIDIERLEHDPEADQVQVEKLKLQKRKQGIDAINAKTNILKNDDTNIEVNIHNNYDDLFSEEDILRFLDESDFIEEDSE